MMKRRNAFELLATKVKVCKASKRASKTREQTLHRQEQNRTQLVPRVLHFSAVHFDCIATKATPLTTPKFVHIQFACARKITCKCVALPPSQHEVYLLSM